MMGRPAPPWPNSGARLAITPQQEPLALARLRGGGGPPNLRFLFKTNGIWNIEPKRPHMRPARPPGSECHSISLTWQLPNLGVVWNALSCTPPWRVLALRAAPDTWWSSVDRGKNLVSESATLSEPRSVDSMALLLLTFVPSPTDTLSCNWASPFGRCRVPPPKQRAQSHCQMCVEHKPFRDYVIQCLVHRARVLRASAKFAAKPVPPSGVSDRPDAIGLDLLPTPLS